MVLYRLIYSSVSTTVTNCVNQPRIKRALAYVLWKFGIYQFEFCSYSEISRKRVRRSSSYEDLGAVRGQLTHFVTTANSIRFRICLRSIICQRRPRILCLGRLCEIAVAMSSSRTQQIVEDNDADAEQTYHIFDVPQLYKKVIIKTLSSFYNAPRTPSIASHPLQKTLMISSVLQ